jgi:hypothetical protein
LLTRFQVFVSSTFLDLRREREAVLHALLEMDCIPVGMELFPAANEEQWSYIKRCIKACDYYVVISAGRYGSIGPNGLSFTEMEYRYGRRIGKPVIAFLHTAPSSLPAKLGEPTAKRRQKLMDFRKLCQERLCKQWSSANDLAASFTPSLVRLMADYPSSGWVKGQAYQDIIDEYAKAQSFLRRLMNLQQVPFRFLKRVLVHTIHLDGSGSLVEDFTLSPETATLFLYPARYGVLHRMNVPVRPKVTAWDSHDGSPLSVCMLREDDVSARFGVLLDRPATIQKPRSVKIVCERKGLWKGLLDNGQIDGHLTVERPCNELVLRFEAPHGRKWQSLRSNPAVGSVQQRSVKGKSVLVWRMKNLRNIRLGYRLSFK